MVVPATLMEKQMTQKTLLVVDDDDAFREAMELEF
jgi:hypothetical protein